MESPKVTNGIKSYPLSLAQEMEDLIRELANLELEECAGSVYIQDKAEDLVVKLNG